jgi:hypothetical protein
LVVAGLLSPLAVAGALAGRWQATGDQLPAARHVVVVAAPGLALRELRHGPLRRVTPRAAVGAMSVRALHTRPGPDEGYVALGSGVRTRSVPAARRGEVSLAHSLSATPRDEDSDGGRAAARGATSDEPGSRAAAAGGVADGRVVAIDALLAANRGRRLRSAPGALGSALKAAGRDIVVVGEGPAALAAMDRRGRVTAARGSPLAIARRHDVVVVAARDAGEAARLLAAPPPTDTLVMLVSVSPAPDGQLTPALIRGARVPPGRLVSDSTRRDAIVTLGDVAPTILGALGVARPAGMSGRALRTRAGPARVGRLLDLDVRSARQASAYRMIIYLAAGALLALVALARVRDRRVATAAALAATALPLAAYLIRVFPNPGSDAIAAGLTALIGVVVAAAAAAVTRNPRAALTVVLGVTAGVLALDGATGGWLHTTTMLGYSLPGGGRFYGMPNTTFSLLAAATVIVAGLMVERYGRAALPGVALGFVVVALLNCVPGLGSDVGGLLTLTPVFGITWIGLSGRRVRARHVAVLAVAALVLLVALAAADLLRPDAQRTHLGRLVAEMLEVGPRPLWDAIVRKESANFTLLLHSPWSVALLVVLVVPLLLRTRLSPAMSAAVAGNLVLATVGFATNDSGPVVVALALFYLGPLLAIYRVRDRSGAVTAERAQLRAGPAC